MTIQWFDLAIALQDELTVAGKIYRYLLRTHRLTARKVLSSCSEESYSSNINVFYGLRYAVQFAMLALVFNTMMIWSAFKEVGLY